MYGFERYTEKEGVNLVTEHTVDLILRTPERCVRVETGGLLRGSYGVFEQVGKETGSKHRAVIFIISIHHNKTRIVV